MKPDGSATVNAFEVQLSSEHSQKQWKNPTFLWAGLFRTRGLLVLLAAMFSVIPHCSRSSANQYDPGEANILVAAAYGAKDGECGTNHTFSSILFFPSDRANVEACVAAVLETSCTSWAVADPTPTICKFIGVQFES